MNWKFFIGSCVLASMLLLAYGAPIPALAAGIGLAAFFNWKSQRNVPMKVRAKTPPRMER